MKHLLSILSLTFCVYINAQKVDYKGEWLSDKGFGVRIQDTDIWFLEQNDSTWIMNEIFNPISDISKGLYSAIGFNLQIDSILLNQHILYEGWIVNEYTSLKLNPDDGQKTSTETANYRFIKLEIVSVSEIIISISDPYILNKENGHPIINFEAMNTDFINKKYTDFYILKRNRFYDQ
jgi:hypothetical protein